MQVNEHVSPVTPLHVVGDWLSVSPLLQLFAEQLPPANDPPAPHTCVPEALYPALQLNEHVSPVTPLQVVGEFEIDSPLSQPAAMHPPPEKKPSAPQT